MATIGGSDYVKYLFQTSAATTNIYTPTFLTAGTNDPLNRAYPVLPSFADSLVCGVAPAPHVETEKEWLRRRVNETLWQAA